MNIHAYKSKENKNQSVAQTSSQNQAGVDPIFQFIDNRQESISQNKLQETVNNSSQSKQAVQFQLIADIYSTRDRHLTQKENTNSSRTNISGENLVQRKIKIQGGQMINAVTDLQDEDVDLSSLAGPINSDKIYLAKSKNDLLQYDGWGGEILGPYRHIIGENHEESSFKDIKAEWPEAKHMEEGQHRAEEQNLELPKDVGHKSYEVFNDIANAVNKNVEPLENYHAAQSVRLALFLAVWNEHWNNLQIGAPTTVTDKALKRHIPETASIANEYVHLSLGVYKRGLENRGKIMTFLEGGPSYSTAIEKQYDKIYNLVKSEKSVKALTYLDQYRDDINSSRTPQLTQEKYLAVKEYVYSLIKPLGDLLLITNNLGSQLAGSNEGAKGFQGFMEQSKGDLRTKDIGNILKSGNVSREVHMARNIGQLDTPGLVKVGKDHIPGLQKLGIQDTLYYPDALDFWMDAIKTTGDLK